MRDASGVDTLFLRADIRPVPTDWALLGYPLLRGKEAEMPLFTRLHVGVRSESGDFGGNKGVLLTA